MDHLGGYHIEGTNFLNKLDSDQVPAAGVSPVGDLPPQPHLDDWVWPGVCDGGEGRPVPGDTNTITTDLSLDLQPDLARDLTLQITTDGRAYNSLYQGEINNNST